MVSSWMLNFAALMTAPRVPIRLWWQSRKSWATGRSAPRSSARTATFAALAASAPCPRPSTTATSPPSMVDSTRCRSPDSLWPDWTSSATAHPSAGLISVSIA
jgi:hypothetical protein